MSKPMLKYKQGITKKFNDDPELQSLVIKEIAARLGLDLQGAAKILELMKGRRYGHNGNSVIIGGPTGWQWKATLASDPEDHHGDFSGFGGVLHHLHEQLSGVGPDDHHPRIHSTGSDFPAVADPGDLFYHLILKTLSVNQGV
ncbi:hypothetical protein ES703_112990 [subsurface metagenome]